MFKKDIYLLKSYIATFVIVSLFLLPVVNAYAIIIDANYGVNGLVITGTQVEGSVSNKFAIQNDNKQLIAGSTQSGGYTSWKMERYNGDGTLDTSFGTNGAVIKEFGFDTAINGGIVLQEDGKIIAMGGSTKMDRGIILIGRFNKDGSVDTSFGTNGFTQFQFPGAIYAWLNAVALQEDGKILVGGEEGIVDNAPSFVARFNADGTPDVAFGNDGVFIFRSIITPYGRVISLKSLPQGKILAYGTLGGIGGDPLLLYRLNDDGSLDTSFGTNGYVYDHFGPQYDIATDMDIQSDGKIVITGFTAADWERPRVFVMRYNADGMRDTGFATNGLYIINSQYQNSQSNTIHIQSDGKIIFGGGIYNDVTYNPFIGRLHIDGTEDITFGSNGSFIIPSAIEGVVSQVLPDESGSLYANISSGNDTWGLFKYLDDAIISPTIIPPTIIPTATSLPEPTQIPTTTLTPMPTSIEKLQNNRVIIDDSKERGESSANDKWSYYGDGWIHCGRKTNVSVCSSDAYNSTLSSTHKKNSYASIYFTGRKIILYGVRDTLSGVVEITLDNTTKQIVNLYSPTTGNSKLWESTMLSPGKHVVTMQLVEDGKSDSLIIDKAEIIKSTIGK